ncbi:MAG: PQQ-like beta-propeller repeat protein, partial [Planctomycetales bacterium]
AAPTPVVDAERLFVFYESGDLIALNHQGDQLWKRSLTKEHGKIQGAHGLGGSLAQTDDAVIVLIDHGGPSYLLAVDKKTGETQWKTDRSGGTSWSSPIVSKRGGQTEILVSGAGTLDGYDAGTGKRKWTVKGLTGNNVPSPTASGDLIVVGAQEPQSNLAVRVKTNGDATAAEVAWRAKKASSSFGSPLIHRGHVYFVNRAGAASCLDLKTGEPRWTERLPGSTWASALGAGDRVYFFTQEGAAAVFAAGGELKLLAENKLTVGKRLYGFAAINGALILRGGNQLIRVGK